MSAKSAGPVLIDEMSSAEFARRARTRPLVIVPFGSVEEHGSHLPLCTDSYQAEEIASRVARAFGALLCPPIRYGECRSTRNFPGTISLGNETVRSLALDITSELARNGIDKVMLLTGHAGSAHMAALRSGALGAVEKYPKLKVMVLSDYDIAYDLRGKEFPENDGHAGEIETSRILRLRPELVGRPRPKGTSRPPKFMVLADPENYFPTGVMGDSSAAAAKKGRKIDDYIVRKLCELVTQNFGLKKVG